MNNYAVTFVARDPLDDVTVDRLLDDLGAGVAVQAGLTTLDLYIDGDNALDAVRRIVPELDRLGVWVDRVMLDLVTRAEISRRAGVTKPGVSKWVSKAQAVNAFPKPHTLTEVGPLWVWDDVNEWLRRTQRDFESWRSISATDENAINTWLASRASFEFRASVSYEYIPQGTLPTSSYSFVVGNA